MARLDGNRTAPGGSFNKRVSDLKDRVHRSYKRLCEANGWVHQQGTVTLVGRTVILENIRGELARWDLDEHGNLRLVQP